MNFTPNQRQTRFDILVVGDVSTNEMQQVRSFLNSTAEDQKVSCQPDLPYRSRYHDPDLIIVCQNWPDEFSVRDVRNSLATFPLSRWVCCYGVWCESDGRNRDIWLHSVRVAARTCFDRLAHEVAVITRKSPPLPLTASRDEVFAYDHTATMIRQHARNRIAIVSPDREFRNWLCDLLSEAGQEVVDFPSSDISPELIIWDTDPVDDDRFPERITEAKRQYPQAEGIALMHMPHVQDAVRLKNAGIRSVICKLGCEQQLIEALQSVP